MDEGDTINFACPNCGASKFTADEDGYFYCVCGYQADDIVDTGVADEDFIDKSTRGAVYQASHRRATASTPIATVKTEPSSQFYSQSQPWSSITQLQTGKTPKKEEYDASFNANPISSVGPTEPEDFALPMSYENCHYAVRMRYVLGLQLMLQLQCEALVDKCAVSPLILGFSGPIWMRFLAATRVFDDGWADDCIHDSELQIEGTIAALIIKLDLEIVGFCTAY